MPGTTFSYLILLPVGSWIWLKAIVAPLFVAVKISTGIETRASLICPFQYARAAMSSAPVRFAGDSIPGGVGGSARPLIAAGRAQAAPRQDHRADDAAAEQGAFHGA